MTDQLYIGDFTQGLTTNKLPFAIANDAFPLMEDFYTWRGRVKRKRGTTELARLRRQIAPTDPVTLRWQSVAVTLVAGAANLITVYSLGSTASIAPGTISLTIPAGETYTDLTLDGVLLGSSGGSGTINYATGDLTISGGAASIMVGTFSYHPGLPVMALANFQDGSNPLPELLTFDTTYSYRIGLTSTTGPKFNNTNFFRSSSIPFEWSGQDHQLFNTTNYSGALWATNNKPGKNFLTGTYTAGTGTQTITMNLKYSAANFTSLVIGDKLWFNEWSGVGVTLNGIVGTVSTITDAANGNYVVTFIAAQTVVGSGICQMLTNSVSGQDGIRWYDGDQTGGTGLPTGSNVGWVNFAPPLSAVALSIDNYPEAIYYLVGALEIIPFKDRLLFSSPWIQTSTSGTPIQLTDVMLWSWNGTPYYTPTATQVVGGTTNVLSSYAPTSQTADAKSYYVSPTGLGGYLAAGIPQDIKTVSSNEDVLIIGFGSSGSGRKTRFVYTGDDVTPFLFFNINSELPSNGPFSAISLDKGCIDVGMYGICITDQQSCQRIDLQIPNQVFDIKQSNNGFNRINAIREFNKEWIYFSYPSISTTDECNFPTRTLLFNYREATWAILKENFTAHGSYVTQSGYTWATVPYPTWADWNVPWNEDTLNESYPKVIAGTPQGFVVFKGSGTGEAPTRCINAVSSSGNCTITSINHCLEIGDYIDINSCLGITLSGIYKVLNTIDADTFVIDATSPVGTYLGSGTITKLSQPSLLTKEFPFYWDRGLKTTIKTQKYLLDKTDSGECTLNIYLSTDVTNAYNSGSVVPTQTPAPLNNALIYSQTLFTCPETNNLQMPTASSQYQIWHRFSTPMTGDTIQFGLTLSDAQMRNITTATSEIALHAMVFKLEAAADLA